MSRPLQTPIHTKRSQNPVVVAATCEKNSPIYAVAVLAEDGCRIFAEEPPNYLSHNKAAQAIDYVAKSSTNVLAYHGKRFITALINICRKFSDHKRIAVLLAIAQNTSDIAQRATLASIFTNNDKHGPSFNPYPQSFTHWNTHPKKVIAGLINEIACLTYLHSTTTPHGKLARLSAGANVNTAFYTAWTKHHSHKIDYTTLRHEFTSPPQVSPIS